MNCVFIQNFQFFVHFTRKTTKLEVKTPNCFSRKLMYFLICLLLMIMVTSFFYIYNNRIQQKYKKRRQKTTIFHSNSSMAEVFFKVHAFVLLKKQNLSFQIVLRAVGEERRREGIFFVSWLAKFSGSMGLNEDLYRCSK